MGGGRPHLASRLVLPCLPRAPHQTTAVTSFHLSSGLPLVVFVFLEERRVRPRLFFNPQDYRSHPLPWGGITLPWPLFWGLNDPPCQRRVANKDLVAHSQPLTHTPCTGFPPPQPSSFDAFLASLADPFFPVLFPLHREEPPAGQPVGRFPAPRYPFLSPRTPTAMRQVHCCSEFYSGQICASCHEVVDIRTLTMIYFENFNMPISNFPLLLFLCLYQWQLLCLEIVIFNHQSNFVHDFDSQTLFSRQKSSSFLISSNSPHF